MNDFSEYMTEPGDCIDIDGTVTRRDMIKAKERYRFFENGQTKLISIPLNGGLALVAVLGDDSDWLADYAAAEYTDVDLWIPKLDTESAFGREALAQYLTDRGAVDAFNADTADFSRMADYPWFISDILQKAKIKTDEEGLEAAAVTMVRGHSSSYYSVMLEVEYTNEQGAPETTAVQFGSTHPNSLPKVSDQLQVSCGLTGMVTHPNRDLIGVGGVAVGIGGLFLMLLLLTMWRDRKRVHSPSHKAERNS